jgi:hypothetical protein
MARRTVWLLGLVVFLPGCIPSLDPLSDPAKAEPDKRLLGDWAKPGEKVQLRIDAPEVKGNPKGLLRATNPTKPDSAHEIMWFFTTTINQDTYANILLDRGKKEGAFTDFAKEGAYETWQKSKGKCYLVAHYAVNGDELTFNNGNNGAFDALLKKEKIEEDADGFPKAPEGWLAKYLTKNGPGELYPKDKGEKRVRQKK